MSGSRWLERAGRRIWNGRDDRGHYTTPATVDRRCPHACCQGKRKHPPGEPIRRASAVDHYSGDAARWASDAGVDLPFFDPDPADDPERHHRGHDLEHDQVWTEHDQAREDERSREYLATARAHRLKAKQRAHTGRNRALDDDYAEYVAYCDSMYADAARATRGTLLNRAGKAAGIREHAFFAYDARTRPGARYMSDELRAWMGDQHVAAGVKGSRGGVLSYAAWKRQHRRKVA